MRSCKNAYSLSLIVFITNDNKIMFKISNFNTLLCFTIATGNRYSYVHPDEFLIDRTIEFFFSLIIFMNQTKINNQFENNYLDEIKCWIIHGFNQYWGRWIGVPIIYNNNNIDRQKYFKPISILIFPIFHLFEYKIDSFIKMVGTK